MTLVVIIIKSIKVIMNAMTVIKKISEVIIIKIKRNGIIYFKKQKNGVGRNEIKNQNYHHLSKK